MNILIADDDASTRLTLQSILGKWGYNVTVACDGDEAWKILCEPEHPHLLILDWLMPGIEGPEIVRRLRTRDDENPYYAIIITSRSIRDSAANALDSGADDFVVKPFENDELRARVAVGYRMNSLQTALSEHIDDLRSTLSRVRQLEGIVPICMSCKKIRDDQNSWKQLEQYISEHSEAKFSHGYCPACAEKEMEAIMNMNRHG
jgi:DNA-binding response OmpR family regulator